MKDDRKKKTDRDDSVESVLYLLGQAWEMEHMEENSVVSMMLMNMHVSRNYMEA